MVIAPVVSGKVPAKLGHCTTHYEHYLEVWFHTSTRKYHKLLNITKRLPPPLVAPLPVATTLPSAFPLSVGSSADRQHLRAKVGAYLRELLLTNAHPKVSAYLRARIRLDRGTPA